MADRVLVVTGALGALGSAVMQAAPRGGWRVAGIDAADADGGPTIRGGVDLTDAAAAARTVDTILQTHGRIDALANIAGGYAHEPIAGADPATWRRMFEINVMTALGATRAVLPHLPAETGAVVNVAAAGALHAGAGMGAYAAAKSGVIRLTEALADELKPRGIRVNAVLPSILDTPANRAQMPKADPGRWVSPAALAETILFLLSPAARAITGALVPVTGRV